MVDGDRLLRIKSPPVVATQDGADFEDAFAGRVGKGKISQEVETGVGEDVGSVVEALAHEVLGMGTGWQAVRIDPDI